MKLMWNGSALAMADGSGNGSVAERQQPSSARSRRLLPVLGAAWLLFAAGTAAYLLHLEFYANAAKQLWCPAAGGCRGLVRAPDSVPGIVLAVVAVAVFAALFVVPHRGWLRVARIAMLAALIAASWGAEALLFTPFFFWH
jgi:hypothetical protein